MKKKIKDLALGEIVNYCSKGCRCCPLVDTPICRKVDIDLTEEDMEKEVEVEQ